MFSFSRSLKFDMLMKIGALAVSATLIVVGFNFFSSKNLILDASKDLLNKQNEATIGRIDDFVERMREFHAMNAELIQQRFHNSENIDRNILNNIFLTTLKNFTPLTSISLSVEGEGVILAQELKAKKDSKEKYLGLDIPENTVGAVVVQNVNERQSRVTFFNYKNDLLQETAVNSPESIKNDYNKSKETIHSSPNFIDLVYNEHTKEQEIRFISRITLTKKQEKAILASAISMHEFSLFMNEIRLSENTRMFLISPDGKVLSDSNMTIQKQETLLTSIGDEVIESILDQTKILQSGTDVFTSAQVNDEGYYVLLSSIPKGIGLKGSVVTITKQSDFLQNFFEQQKIIVIIMIFGTVIILILLYFQTANIADPIESVMLEAEKIERLDLQDDFLRGYEIKELNQMSQSMSYMKNTIRNLVKYIPKGLVLRFKEKGVENEVGGTNTNLTLMFTDIEGFSSISEKIDRTMDLTVHLSNYFDELAKIISKNDGIIDKFIGDAIMCFWGAPDKDEQQETKACRTALSCKRRLDILNAYWEFVGKPVFKTRFGIHSGNCVVGNIGSKDRFNYTALGDNVNLAARLEGANKIFSTSIIISDSVKNKLPPNFITRLLDTVAVKGKKKEVEIFELCGIQNEKDFVPVSDDAIQYFKKFEVMVRHYRVKEFSKALDILTELQSLPYAANDTELLNLYFTRCANHIALPVGDDWDGVTHLTEK